MHNEGAELTLRDENVISRDWKSRVRNTEFSRKSKVESRKRKATKMKANFPRVKMSNRVHFCGGEKAVWWRCCGRVRILSNRDNSRKSKVESRKQDYRGRGRPRTPNRKPNQKTMKYEKISTNSILLSHLTPQKNN